MTALKRTTTREQFQNDVKDYVINMTSNARILHRKNGCYYSSYFSNYHDFDTLEEAEQSDIVFLKCEICFGGVKDENN